MFRKFFIATGFLIGASVTSIGAMGASVEVLIPAGKGVLICAQRIRADAAEFQVSSNSSGAMAIVVPSVDPWFGSNQRPICPGYDYHTLVFGQIARSTKRYKIVVEGLNLAGNASSEPGKLVLNPYTDHQDVSLFYNASEYPNFQDVVVHLIYQ